MNEDNQEILNLLKENNDMLKLIIAYINFINLNASTENNNDFMRNIIANMISSSFEGKLLRN